MVRENINMPNEPSEINSPGGFFASLTEDQAQKFYEIIKAEIK